MCVLFLISDKENISPSQNEDSFMISSKDTIHIIRLSCILHIIDSYLKRQLNPRLHQGEMPDNVISEGTLASARLLYHNLAQKKSIFIEVNYIYHDRFKKI